MRSSCSGWKVTRVSGGAFSRLARCCRRRRRRKRVSWLFLVSRVVKMSVNDWDIGRVIRNSSRRRQQVAKPRPLSGRLDALNPANHIFGIGVPICPRH